MSPKDDLAQGLPDPVRDILLEGEQTLAIWRPSFWRFAQQFVIVGALTSLLLGFTDVAQTPLQWAALFFGSIFFWGFIFDDWKTWLARRGDLWVLTDSRLIYHNPAEAVEAVGLRLDQITGLSRWPYLTLRVKMADGQKVLMRFLPQPREIRARIWAEREAYLA